MAVLWQKIDNGVSYEVRAAGQTRRLYTNGVFHSQYNPNKLLTGGVWDLLMLPAFFYPVGHIKRVLVLGVGGGAVIHQLQRYVRPRHIDGVELSATHLHVAKKYFEVRKSDATLHQADAREWARKYRGPRFDMIIDDLFGEQDGEPVRAVAASATWVRQLLRLLTPEGLIVSNFISRKELKTSAYIQNPLIRQRFSKAFVVSHALEENTVAAFLRRNTACKEFAMHLSAEPALYRAWRSGRLCTGPRVMR